MSHFVGTPWRGCVASLVLVLALCTAAGVAGDKSAVADAGSPKANAAPTVKLIEAGAEPRRVMRFTPKDGQRLVMRTRIESNSSIQLGGKPYPADPNPTLIMQIAVTIDVEDEQSDYFTLTQTIEEFDVEDSDAIAKAKLESIRAQYQQIENLQIVSQLDNRGNLISADIVPPADAPPGLQPAFEQMKDSASKHYVPLPEEPVGIGGKWEVAVGPIGPTGIMQTTVHTLRHRDGDHVEVEIELSQTATAKQLTRTKLVSLETSGSGTMSVQLNKITTSSSIQTTTTSEFEIGDPSEPSILRDTTKTDVTVETEVVSEDD